MQLQAGTVWKAECEFSRLLHEKGWYFTINPYISDVSESLNATSAWNHLNVGLSHVNERQRWDVDGQTDRYLNDVHSDQDFDRRISGDPIGDLTLRVLFVF